MLRIQEKNVADDHHPLGERHGAATEAGDAEARRGDRDGQAKAKREHNQLHHRPDGTRQPADTELRRYLHPVAGREDRERHADERRASESAQRHAGEGQCLLRYGHRDRRGAPRQQCLDRRDNGGIDTYGECLEHRECGGDHGHPLRGIWRPLKRRGQGEHPQGKVALHRRRKGEPAYPDDSREPWFRPGGEPRRAEHLVRARPIVL